MKGKNCSILCEREFGDCKGVPQLVSVTYGTEEWVFEYCENAIQRDRDAGFIVTPLSELPKSNTSKP